MVLYAKTLGASATVLGIIAGMMPLLVIFQIPASKHLGRIGYKKFVFAGLGNAHVVCVGFGAGSVDGRISRSNNTACVGAPAAVRIQPDAWDHELRVAALDHGADSSDVAWAIFGARCGLMNIGSFLVFIIAALVLETDPHAWQFALLFAFSAAMAGDELDVFCDGCPMAQVPAGHSGLRTPVPVERNRYLSAIQQIWSGWRSPGPSRMVA